MGAVGRRDVKPGNLFQGGPPSGGSGSALALGAFFLRAAPPAAPPATGAPLADLAHRADAELATLAPVVERDATRAGPVPAAGAALGHRLVRAVRAHGRDHHPADLVHVGTPFGSMAIGVGASVEAIRLQAGHVTDESTIVQFARFRSIARGFLKHRAETSPAALISPARWMTFFRLRGIRTGGPAASALVHGPAPASYFSTLTPSAQCWVASAWVWCAVTALSNFYGNRHN